MAKSRNGTSTPMRRAPCSVIAFAAASRVSSTPTASYMAKELSKDFCMSSVSVSIGLMPVIKKRRAKEMTLAAIDTASAARNVRSACQPF